MTSKDRILIFIKEIGVKQADFFNLIGVSASNFKGDAKKSELGSDKIVKILTQYPQLSPDWLLLGVGNMFRAESEKEEKLPSVNQTYEGAPYFNVDFIGGFDLIVNDQTVNPDFYINYPPYNQPGVLWCNLTGHSMEPEISNGDIIALREVTTPIQYLPAGEIYGIVTEEYRTVKRIRLSQKEGFVRLIPSNKSDEFCEQEIPISMILKVYAVLGSIRKFF